MRPASIAKECWNPATIFIQQRERATVRKKDLPRRERAQQTHSEQDRKISIERVERRQFPRSLWSLSDMVRHLRHALLKIRKVGQYKEKRWKGSG